MTSQYAKQQRDLERYQAILRHARATLRQKFVEKEIALILEAHDGHWIQEPWNAEHISAEVEDAIRLNRLDQKLEISGPLILSTMRGLNFVESVALSDVIERWWNRVGNGEINLSVAAALEEPNP